MASSFVQIFKHAIVHRRWYFWLSLLLLSACAVWSWLNIFSAEYFESETAFQYRGTQQVFFDDGTGIREERSHREYIEATFTYVRYRFPLIVENPVMIRVDPVDVSGWVKFKRLAIKPKWNWKGVPLIEKDVSRSGISKLHFDEEQGVWTSFPEMGNTDPFLVFTNLPVQVSDEVIQKKKIVSLLSLFGWVIIGSVLFEILFRFVVGKLFFGICKFLIGTSRKPGFGIAAFILCCGISVALIWAMMPEKNKRMSHVMFQWTGYPTEYIQLDYDLGDGFHFGQSRLYYNREKESVFDVDFRLPNESIESIRITVQGGGQTSFIRDLRVNDESIEPNQVQAIVGVEINDESIDQILIHPSENSEGVTFEISME